MATRSGQKWSKEENDLLLQRVSTEMYSWFEIATELQRTAFAIECQVMKNAMHMIDGPSHMTYEEVARILCVDVDAIRQKDERTKNARWRLKNVKKTPSEIFDDLFAFCKKNNLEYDAPQREYLKNIFAFFDIQGKRNISDYQINTYCQNIHRLLVQEQAPQYYDVYLEKRVHEVMKKTRRGSKSSYE